MADGVFNIAKGRVVYYATLPAANDALIVVLLKAAGLEADDTLNNYDDLAALLAASNDELSDASYARKTITSVTVSVDDTNNRTDADFADPVWTALAGAAAGKMLVCYDGDTTTGTDSAVIPLTYHDFAVTPDGSDVTAVLAASGFFRAS